MKKISLYIIIAFGILFSNCEENNNNTLNPAKTNQSIIVDSSLFINAPNDEFNFSNAEVINDSLKLTIRYGGGCGDIELMLIDSEVILESYPLQRNIRLSLKDNDTCEALLTKVISFDLSNIRVKDNNKVSLNLMDWNTSLLYEY